MDPWKDRKFDRDGKFVVRKNFTLAGKHFKRGDPFAWHGTSISDRQVMLLFKQGRLVYEDERGAPDVVEEPQVEVSPEIDEDLREVDKMADLRAIAEAEGAEMRTSKEEQRLAIMKVRNAQ